MLTIEDIIVMLFFTLFFYLLWLGLAARERVIESVKHYCKQLDLQLLDDNVVLRALSFSKNKAGKLRIKRTYSFEFSSLGDERYQGKVVFFDNMIVDSTLEPYRIE